MSVKRVESSYLRVGEARRSWLVVASVLEVGSIIKVEDHIAGEKSSLTVKRRSGAIGDGHSGAIAVPAGCAVGEHNLKKASGV